MRHLMLVLLLIAAFGDALPVPALFAGRGGRIVACACRAEACRCRHCPTHHPRAAGEHRDACALDAADCAGAARVSPSVRTPGTYELPVVDVPGQPGAAPRMFTCSSTHAARATAGELDPPPRAPIA